MMSPCGYCGGSGRVVLHQADHLGPRPDWPAEGPCEYCGGEGACEAGSMLLPQQPERYYQCDDEDRRRAGLPPWA